jgi:hypothetical protein
MSVPDLAAMPSHAFDTTGIDLVPLAEASNR